MRQITQTEVEAKTTEKTYYVCPWCESKVEESEIVTIEKEPRVNKASLTDSFFGIVWDENPSIKKECKIERNYDNPFDDEMNFMECEEMDLTQLRLRGDYIQKYLWRTVEEASIYSEDSTQLCENCAESIMSQ